MNIEIERVIGKNIRELRNRSNITQVQLAALFQINGCDITRSAVAKIEAGQRHLYPDEIIILKKVLKTNYDEILKI